MWLRKNSHRVRGEKITEYKIKNYFFAVVALPNAKSKNKPKDQWMSILGPEIYVKMSQTVSLVKDGRYRFKAKLKWRRNKRWERFKSGNVVAKEETSKEEGGGGGRQKNEWKWCVFYVYRKNVG